MFSKTKLQNELFSNKLFCLLHLLKLNSILPYSDTSLCVRVDFGVIAEEYYTEFAKCHTNGN